MFRTSVLKRLKRLNGINILAKEPQWFNLIESADFTSGLLTDSRLRHFKDFKNLTKDLRSFIVSFSDEAPVIFDLHDFLNFAELKGKELIIDDQNENRYCYNIETDCKDHIDLGDGLKGYVFFL